MIETGLVTLLKTVNSRVYPRTPQQPTFPFIRYQRIGRDDESSIDGKATGLTDYSFQIDCMAKTYSEAKQLAAQVQALLNRYQGAIGDSFCQYATLETENDFDEQDGDDYTHWVSQRYVIYTNDE